MKNSGGIPYLLRPFAMRPSHIDAHLPDVGHFLSLEPIKIGLNGRARILQVSSGEMNRVLQLYVSSQHYEVYIVARTLPVKSSPCSC
jgi:hypothetical protein